MKLKISIFLIFAFLFVSVGNAKAFSFELPNAGITSESPFYFMDKVSEGLGNFFTFGKENKVERGLSIAEERLSEAKQLAQNKSEKTEEAFSKYEEKMKESLDVNDLSGSTLEKIASSTSGHLFVFDEIKDLLENKGTSTDDLSSKIKKQVEKTKENVSKVHRGYLGKLSKKNPEKAAKVFSNSLQNRLKEIKKTAKKEAKEKGKESKKKFEKIGNKIREQEEYMNLGEQISRMAKGIRTGTTSVKELVGKARSHSTQVLNDVKERIENKTGKNFENFMKRKEKMKEKRKEMIEKQNELEEGKKEKRQKRQIMNKKKRDEKMRERRDEKRRETKEKQNELEEGEKEAEKEINEKMKEKKQEIRKEMKERQNESEEKVKETKEKTKNERDNYEDGNKQDGQSW